MARERGVAVASGSRPKVGSGRDVAGLTARFDAVSEVAWDERELLAREAITLLRAALSRSLALASSRCSLPEPTE